MNSVIGAKEPLPKPFYGLSGNPENGNWTDYADYCRSIEELSIKDVNTAYKVISLQLDETQRHALELCSATTQEDTPIVRHAKLLFQRKIALESGIP